MIYDFTFYNPTRIHFGKGALAHLKDEISQYGSSVLLVYGKNSIKRIGLYDEIIAILKAANKNVIELSGINSNPRWSQVLQGCELCRTNHVDLILAVGGGSVIDCSKAISACTYATGDAWERYYMHQEPVDNEIIPIGSVLTMAGTGSEMNSGSVITNEDSKLKVGRVYTTDLNPRFSILNPEYTFSVPKNQMVSGIFDIFSHLMEQYFSGEDDNTTDYLIEGAMRSLIVAARKAVADPQDYEARSNIMWCATVGLNKILGVSKTQDWITHQIEHQVGAYTDCPHGIGLAVITPAYLTYIYKDGLPKFVRYAVNVWDVDPTDKSDDIIAMEGIAALDEFIREMGIPSTLRELGATEDMLEPIAASTEANIVARYGDGVTGYKKIRHNEILEILQNCF